MMPAHLFIFRGMAQRITTLAEQYDREHQSSGPQSASSTNKPDIKTVDTSAQ